ncbi:MAG: hypothetical protein ANABAC_0059 [Anaerolineae bacterium]|nr:MAG: hypothetical protein ANABAC_0059 [Anaerolineae bacterium]
MTHTPYQISLRSGLACFIKSLTCAWVIAGGRLAVAMVAFEESRHSFICLWYPGVYA